MTWCHNLITIRKVFRKKELPIVCLVTCFYQQGKFLDAKIYSVVNQQYPALYLLRLLGLEAVPSKQEMHSHGFSARFFAGNL